MFVPGLLLSVVAGMAVEPILFHIVSIAGAPPAQCITLLTLQGIVNRDGPKLYLLSDPNGAEKRWLDWYEGYDLKGVEKTADDALALYASRAKGFVLYDPAVPDSVNVAVTLAGVMDAVAASPGQTDQLKALGLACLCDLRGKFNDKPGTYRWAIENALPKCDLRYLANFDQGAPPSPRSEMDYLVNHRGVSMGCSVNEADYPDEAALWDQVQTKAPRGAMMLGWHTPRDSEATHVYFGSRHNVRVYCGGASNMSFHQHVHARAPYRQDHCEKAACDPGARYATITLSDGDSWHSMADMQKKFWQDPRRGEVPLGWEVAPAFAEAGPAILEYYFRTRTPNDYLACGPSGIGYNYLSGIPDWEGYLKASADAMERCSLKTIWAINRVVRHKPGGVIEHRLKDGPIDYTRAQMEEFAGIKDKMGADWVDPQMVTRYMEKLPAALGFFQGWERIPGEDPRWVDGRLWCPTSALVRRDIDSVLAEFEQAAARQKPPVFVAGHVNCYDADMDTVIAVVRRLESKGYKVVRPDTFLCLAKDAFQRGLRGKE